MADGYLKIKTKLDNSGIDKDVDKLNDKLNKLQVENADLSQEQRDLEKQIADFEKLQENAEEYRNEIKKIKAEKENLSIGGIKHDDMAQYQALNANLETSRNKWKSINDEIDKQGPKIETARSKLDEVKTKQTENNAKMSEFQAKLDGINAKQIENNEEMAQFQDEVEKVDFEKVESELDNVGSSIQKTIGKVGKMALAVFGVRTAWNAVRSAINLAKQYDSQISTDFEYLGYCLAQLVIPLVQKLVNLIYKVLSYINALTTAWFGLNLFANSSASAFQAMSSSASDTVDSVNEIKKSTQGFDEMNIMSDDSSSGSSSGSGGDSGSSALPSYDLSATDIEIPAWLQWIIDNKDLILSVLAGVVAGIASIKLGFSGLQSLGIGVAIAGIVYTIQSLIAYLNDGSWENFGKIIQGIGTVILGVGIAIGSVPVAVIGAIVLIVGTITKYWDQIRAFFQSGIDWLSGENDTIAQILQGVLNLFDSIFTSIKKIFDGIIQSVKGAFTGDWKSAWEGVKTIFTGLLEGLIGIAKALGYDIIIGLLDGILSLIEGIESWINEHIVQPFIEGFKKLFDINSPSKVMAELGKYLIQGLFNGLSNIWETVQSIFESLLSNVKSIFETMKSTIITIINAIKTTISNVFTNIQNTLSTIWNNIVSTVVTVWDTIVNKIKTAVSGAWSAITSVFGNIANWFKEKFTAAWQAVKDVFSKGGTIFDGIKDGILSGLKSIVNAIITGINKVIAVPFNGLNTALKKIKNISIAGVSPFSWISTISVPQIPTLAKGGVINQPTQAIVGEAGAEAIMPLENNTEWMDVLANKLASKIGSNGGGSYIIQMDSRTIKRGIAKQSNQLAFETNGGVS